MFRVYAKFPGDKRFGALGPVGNGIDIVRNLMYAYIFDDKSKAQRFMDKCQNCVPDALFEIRKA